MQHAFQLLTTTECVCSHVNIREESHGDEKVLAVDLAFYMEGSNDLLDLFHPGLREAIYCNKAADSGQADMPEVLKVLPNLRAPGLQEKLRWGGDDKHGGYRMVLDYGLGDALANIDLTGCVVGKKWLEPKEGGTSRIGWRVSYAGESLQDVMTRGKLTGLKGQKAFLILNPPPVLQLVKPGKGKGKQAPAAPDGGEASTDLLGGEGGSEGRDDSDLDPDSPEGRLAATAGG